MSAYKVLSPKRFTLDFKLCHGRRLLLCPFLSSLLFTKLWSGCWQLIKKLWFVLVVTLPPEHPNCLQVGKAGIFEEKLHINKFFSYIWWAYIRLVGFWSGFDIVQGTILHFLQKLETNQNGNWKKSRQIITIRLCQKFIQMFARIF